METLARAKGYLNPKPFDKGSGHEGGRSRGRNKRVDRCYREQTSGDIVNPLDLNDKYSDYSILIRNGSGNGGCERYDENASPQGSKFKGDSFDRYQNRSFGRSQQHPVNVQVFRGKNPRLRRGHQHFPGDSRSQNVNDSDADHLGSSVHNGFIRNQQQLQASYYNRKFNEPQKLVRFSERSRTSNFRDHSNSSFGFNGSNNYTRNVDFNSSNRNGPVNKQLFKKRGKTNGENPLGMFWPDLNKSPDAENSALSINTVESNTAAVNISDLNKSEACIVSECKKIEDSSNPLISLSSGISDNLSNTVKNGLSINSNVLNASCEALSQEAICFGNAAVLTLNSEDPKCVRMNDSTMGRCNLNKSNDRLKSCVHSEDEKDCTSIHENSLNYSLVTAKNCSPSLETNAIMADFSPTKLSDNSSPGASSVSDSNENSPQKQATESNKEGSNPAERNSRSEGKQSEHPDVRRSPPNNNNQRIKKKPRKGPDFKTYCITLNLQDSFDEQAKKMIKQFEMTPRERARVEHLKYDLHKVFSPIIPNAKQVLFGSVEAGTAFKYSDVDIYLQCYDSLPMGNVRDFIVRYGSAVNKGGLFRQGIKIANARVPIVKAIHNYTGISVDVSFVVDKSESHYGHCNSVLVKHLCSHDARVRDLIMLVLFWAKCHGFVGKHRMSSFTFILLAIFYLQIVDVLPPLCKLISLSPDMDRWPTAFDSNPELLVNSNTETLESLYLGFFTFYSAVRFNEVVISVYAGELILGVLFDSYDGLPECYTNYKQLVEGGKEPALVRGDMCIQEPFNLSWNTARSIQTGTQNLLKNACLNVCNVFAKFSLNRALLIVHSEYQLGHDEENCYTWEIPCPKDLSASGWFKKVLKATKTIFSSILLMEINNNSNQTEESKFCKFYTTNFVEDNPVKLIVSTKYMLPLKERETILKAYQSKPISKLEKEIKASTLLTEELKKKGKKQFFSATVFVARNEKNGSVEVSINKFSSSKNKKARKADHKQFVAFLRNDNFKHFLSLILEVDRTEESTEKCQKDKVEL